MGWAAGENGKGRWTHLGAHSNGNRLSLRTEDELRAPRVEQVQFLRATAHVGVILFDEVPADLILGNSILLLVGGGSIGGSGRLCRLEVGRIIHGRVSVVVGVVVGVLSRVIAVHRSLSGVGHYVEEKRRTEKNF